MKTFLTLFRKELGSYFVSPVAYIVLLACSILIGFTFYFWVEFFITNNIKEVTILHVMNNGYFFWFVLLFQVPVITMRSFSEEFKLGTIEMLLTAPVREWEVVLAKYFAALTFFIILWTPSVLNVSWLHFVSAQKIAISLGMLLLPYGCILLIGGLYVAIGIFASVLTQNQIISAIISFCMIFLFFCFGLLGYVNSGSESRNLIEYFSVQAQMETFSRGIFDTRPVVYYLSGSAFFLFLTQRILLSRRLKA